MLDKLKCDTLTENAATNISTKEWLDHYSSLLQGDKPSKDVPKTGPLDYSISKEEMMNATSILKAGKAPGIDNINNEMILTALTHYPLVFLHIFNTILKNGGGISNWSTSLIVPIHKNGSEDDPENYRGIALISCLAKFFYCILNNRLLEHCIKNKILSPCQLGFLPGNRTSDAHTSWVDNFVYSKMHYFLHVVP